MSKCVRTKNIDEYLAPHTHTQNHTYTWVSVWVFTRTRLEKEVWIIEPRPSTVTHVPSKHNGQDSVVIIKFGVNTTKVTDCPWQYLDGLWGLGPQQLHRILHRGPTDRNEWVRLGRQVKSTGRRWFSSVPRTLGPLYPSPDGKQLRHNEGSRPKGLVGQWPWTLLLCHDDRSTRYSNVSTDQIK